ncbi:MAG TPA: tetratricopeptide repeat protein [Anaerolineae bacterium]|jgi:tetratricopeptide (TPR) repeat protein|nr:tetratricopeptide repeat protein [Anaerolineae bacterium]
MTIKQDSESSDLLIKGSRNIANPEETPSGEKISIWLAGSILFFLLFMFAVAGLIVHKVYFKPPVVHTAAERDLIKYKAAIKKNPKDAEAHVGLAGIYLEAEQTDKAIEELNTAIKLDPHSWDARFELGMAYEALNKTDEAAHQFWLAASADPNNEYAFYQLGRLYHKQKLYGQAIQAYKKTLKINPTLADIHYYLGQCYEETNKRELAKREYKEALKYGDSSPEAKKALKRLK